MNPEEDNWEDEGGLTIDPEDGIMVDTTTTKETQMNKHQFALADPRGVCAKCGIIGPKDSELECGRK